MTDHGAIVQRMGKAAREPETAAHGELYAALGIPILGTIRAPGLAEAGDLVWLDERTLVAGHCYRTNAAGITQLREMLEPHGVQVVELGPVNHSIHKIDEHVRVADLDTLSAIYYRILKQLL